MKVIHLFIFVFLCFYSVAQNNSVVNKVDSMSKEEVKKAHKKAVFLRNKDARGVFLRSLDSIASDSAFVLDIRKMAFRNFPDISRFTNITAIYAENNQFADIKLKSKNLKHIEYLGFNGNQISRFRLGKAPKLKNINLDKNPISKLSFGLFRSKNLEEVSINNSEIAKLPWWFAYKKKISKLYIYNNPMLLSKQNINRMHNITHLQISVMDNDSMPEYFSELVNITKLVIYKSKINRLPKSFYKLSNLEVFILYKNEFTEIPEVCFKLKSLKHLDFYYNKIRYIPMGIIQCNKLEELYLSFNQISVIPDALQEMKNLKRLYIHHNNIEEVPEWINNLYNLEVLDMGYNGISELPSLMELTKLHTVDFQSNSIFKFPLELLDMQSLNRVFLFDNPFEFNIEEGKLFEQKYDSFKQRGGELFID